MSIRNIFKSNKGFSLIELSIAIVILGILVGAVVVGSGLSTKAKIQHETDTMNTLVVAARNYLNASQTTYTGVGIAGLQTSNYLPSTFNATTGNSWGGAYTVAVNGTDATKVDISVVGIPDAATATLLSNNFASMATCAYTVASKTNTCTF